MRVIPVLVHDASMPQADDLPEDLRPLARWHAFEITDTRWRYDVARLIAALERVLDSPATPTPLPDARLPARSRRRVPLLLGVGLSFLSLPVVGDLYGRPTAWVLTGISLLAVLALYFLAGPGRDRSAAPGFAAPPRERLTRSRPGDAGN